MTSVTLLYKKNNCEVDNDNSNISTTVSSEEVCLFYLLLFVRKSTIQGFQLPANKLIDAVILIFIVYSIFWNLLLEQNILWFTMTI